MTTLADLNITDKRMQRYSTSNQLLFSNSGHYYKQILVILDIPNNKLEYLVLLVFARTTSEIKAEFTCFTIEQAMSVYDDLEMKG